jgi:hypothetical protein
MAASRLLNADSEETGMRGYSRPPDRNDCSRRSPGFAPPRDEHVLFPIVKLVGVDQRCTSAAGLARAEQVLIGDHSRSIPFAMGHLAAPSHPAALVTSAALSLLIQRRFDRCQNAKDPQFLGPLEGDSSIAFASPAQSVGLAAWIFWPATGGTVVSMVPLVFNKVSWQDAAVAPTRRRGLTQFQHWVARSSRLISGIVVKLSGKPRAGLVGALYGCFRSSSAHADRDLPLPKLRSSPEIHPESGECRLRQ